MDLGRAVNLSPPHQLAHPCGGARGFSSRDVLGVVSIDFHQPLSGQVKGQQENGSWQEASSNVQTSTFFFFSLAAIKGRRLNQDIHSKQLSPWWIAGTCPQPALLDGSDHGLGKKPRGRGRNAHQLCPSPAIALLMEQREIISLVRVHHLPAAQRRRRKTTDISRHFAR